MQIVVDNKVLRSAHRDRYHVEKRIDGSISCHGQDGWRLHVKSQG